MIVIHRICANTINIEGPKISNHKSENENEHHGVIDLTHKIIQENKKKPSSK